MSFETEEESEELRSESSFSDSESFHSQYTVVKTIGHGGLAKVKQAQHRLTGTPVAVKMIRKRNHWCHPVTTEAKIMMKANHPNIISLLQVIETEKRIYLIMELVEGKSLSRHIREAGHLQEDEARAIFKQMLSAMSYCHALGIVHRDLKMDNIMIDSKGRIKIIDFGLSTQVKPGQQLSYYCGTYPFAAPELLLGRLYDGRKTDMWSLGVVLYFMLTGRMPFDALNVPHLRRQVLSGKYPVPSRLSKELQDLLSLLLTVNPTQRLTVAKAMMHPWLTVHSQKFPQPCEELTPIRPDPAIIKAMGHLGFQAQDIKDSLCQKKYNEAMASYCFLKEQALQECDSPPRAQPMNPSITPFPSLDDPTTFLLRLRKRESQPKLLGSSSTSESAVSSQKGLQRRERRVSWPGGLPCRPVQTSPTVGQALIRSTSVPCTHSMLYGAKNSSQNDSRGDLPTTSAKENPVPSRGQPRGFKWWTRNIRNTLRSLCCCILPRKKSHRGRNRVSPKKGNRRKVSGE